MTSVLASPISTPLKSVKYGSAFKYNSNYPSQYVAGDTWYSTWADDNKIYITANDFLGWNGVTPTSNMLISTVSTLDSSVVGTTVNNMNIFGTEDTTGGSDSATWKSTGLISVNGVLYWFVSRQHYGNSGNAFIQSALSSQLIKSTDHGVTWTPLPPAGVSPYVSMMFTSTNFAAPGFVQYGQDYQNNFADNSNTYIYATSTDGVWNNGSNLYLGRVSVANIGNQLASDWTFYTGGDGMVNGNWSSTLASAVPIVTKTSQVGITSVQYLPIHGRYIMFEWYYPNPSITNNTFWNTYEAAHPWGPWTLIQSDQWDPQGYYNPNIVPKSMSTDGGLTAVIAVAGDYSTAFQTNGMYTLTYVPITISK